MDYKNLAETEEFYEELTGKVDYYIHKLSLAVQMELEMEGYFTGTVNLIYDIDHNRHWKIELLNSQAPDVRGSTLPEAVVLMKKVLERRPECRAG